MGKHFLGRLVDSAPSGCDVLIGFSFSGQPFGGEEPRLVGGDRHVASNRDRPIVVHGEFHFIITHTLMNGGHLSAAIDTASRQAARLDGDQKRRPC